MSDLDLLQRSRRYLWISAGLILLFFINLLVGKLSLMWGFKPFLHLDGVPEFLLLLIAVSFFVVSTLLSHSARNAAEQNQSAE